MNTFLEIPTYKSLLELSDRELEKRANKAFEQLNQAEIKGEKTTEKTIIYILYKVELTKRNYRRMN